MTDDMLRALARNGGTIQINFECSYLSQRNNDYLKAHPRQRGGNQALAGITDPQERAAAMAKARAEEAEKNPPATIADVVAHIDHAVEIAGIDHVGIGTDFDGSSCIPPDLNNYAKFPALTRALLEKGYTADDIKKIYGGNTIRVMRAVEKRAQELKSMPPIETKFPGESAGREY
jgi:membrane dipeptidase